MKRTFKLQFAILSFFVGISAATQAQLSSSNRESLRNELIQLVNNFRSENGRKPLLTDPILRSAANLQCDYMVKADSLTHFQKKGTHKTPEKRVKFLKGDKFEAVGENILFTAVESFKLGKNEIAELANTMFLQWENSSEHRENMLQTEYTFGDIGLKEDVKKKRIFAAQVFARMGIKIDGQLSSNGFGIRSAPDDCAKEYEEVFSDVLNIGNGIQIENNELVLYVHSIELFKQVMTSSKDGLMVDLLIRDHFPCLSENQLDMSSVYDGIVTQPIYRDQILANNRAENPLHLIATIGKLPVALQGTNPIDIGLSTILLRNGVACQYVIQTFLPAEDFELVPLEPILIDRPKFLLSSTGVKTIEQLTYEFEASNVDPIRLPTISTKGQKVKAVSIYSYSSVEGNASNNASLQKERANSIRTDLMNRLKLRNDQIHLESKENWEMMRFQLYYLGADSIAALPNDSIRAVIARGEGGLNWDSLLFVQRRASATIYFESTVATNTSIEKIQFNLKQGIAMRDFTFANNCLNALYPLDDYAAECVFEDGIFDVLKVEPLLVQNAAALLSKVYYSDVTRTTEFLFAWINRRNELNEATRHNLLNLWTKLGLEFLDTWDVSSERLANVVHPSRIGELVYSSMPPELMLNIQLLNIQYYGQINDYKGIQTSFNFISDYFKARALTQEDAVRLSYFYNYWSTYNLNLQYLWALFDTDNLNEDGIFALAQTMNFVDPDDPRFEEVNNAAFDANERRWCKWINTDFQLLRNSKLKGIYCESCD